MQLSCLTGIAEPRFLIPLPKPASLSSVPPATRAGNFVSQDTGLLSPSLLTLPVGDSKLQCKVPTFPPNAPLRMHLGYVLKPQTPYIQLERANPVCSFKTDPEAQHSLASPQLRPWSEPCLSPGYCRRLLLSLPPLPSSSAHEIVHVQPAQGLLHPPMHFTPHPPASSLTPRLPPLASPPAQPLETTSLSFGSQVLPN